MALAARSSLARWLGCRRGSRPGFLEPHRRTISVRASQRKFREASFDGPNQKLLEDAPDKVENRRNPADRSGDLIRATGEMKSRTRAGDYEGALDIFESAKQPDSILYTAALSACAKAHWYDRAIGFWETMPADGRTVVSYSVMIDLCGRLKRLTEAEGFLQTMRSSSVQPNIVTLTSMARAYGMADEPEGALQLLEEGRPALAAASLRGRQMFYQVVMSAFARAGDYAKTRELFVQMTESCTQADHGHFNALLASCAKHHLQDTAEAVFEYMRSCGMQPRLEDYNILLGCRRQSLARCVELYAELQAKGFRPTSTTQQQLLEAYVLAGDGPGALAFASEAHALDTGSRKVDQLLRDARQLSRAAA